MEEKKIIESVSNYKKIVSRAAIIFAILAVIGLITYSSVQTTIDECSDIVYGDNYYDYYGNYYDFYDEEEEKIASDKLSSAYDKESFGLWLMVICAPIAIILLVFYLDINKMQIVVTDKRVYGKTSFGKQVDLPLDSISAVGTSLFKGISVGTSSGKISFLAISNRDEIYGEIKKILADRQEKEIKVKASTPIANITQELSNADELKKFKDLLDNGVITQEEFDAKKKQLLGL